MVRLALLVDKASKRLQRLYIKVAKMFALLFYHGIQSEGRFTFQVTHALPIRVKCFDAALQ